MTISGYSTETEFGEAINQLLSPSRPIQSIQFLRGREEELKNIGRALLADGRHVFIYGDRGVGKSSLAATAARQYQSTDAEPIAVTSGRDDTFKTVVANIANLALGRSKTQTTSQSKNLGFEWRGLKWSAGQEINPTDIMERINSIGDAAQLLHEVGPRHSQKPIVVIDEFDTLGNLEERNKFAYLLKHLGDLGANIKIIFTGVGRSLDEIVGAHASAHRQLEQVELYRLGWDARKEIVQSTVASFGLTVDNIIEWRIPMVSDGYPYYVHLMTERMLWAAFDDALEVHNLGPDHFLNGLRSAITSIHAELKKPYEKAVFNRSDFVEEVLWSTADGFNIDRQLSDMYATYKYIAEKRGYTEFMDSKQYSAQVRKLKNASHGSILSQIEKRPRWYTYTEKMLRGYVRMQAEANGVELRGEREAPKQIMHIGNARTGSYGSAPPKGVQLGRRKADDDDLDQ